MRREDAAVCGRVAILAGLLLFGGACTAGPKTGEGVRLTPAAMLYERDIPIPSGFRMVESACEDQSTGTRRLYLRHLYEGRAPSKYSVRKFYREQMPRARWALVSDGNVKGVYTLRFEKGTESCSVQITGGEGRFGAKTRIQAIIAQEERGKSPPESGTKR
ncbi:MAG: hypothetical protein JSV19_10845 [Phycisphaerales bacterium]|nr:MAG: hypothetical protein JSV19_10845 [Phycisphaerales bacterium]